MFREDEFLKAHKRRIAIIANIVLFSYAIILARLWYLQIYKGDVLQKYSLENRLRREIVRSPRGMVFGRNNELLIHNVPRFDAIITPQYLKNDKESIRKLSKILNIPVPKIGDILKKSSRQASYRSIVIKKNISRREVAIIETENSKMPGVGVQVFISREYKDEEIGGHLLGYISEISQTQLPKFSKRDNFKYRLGDFIGQAGLEEKFDFQLRGENGYEYMEVDAYGRKKRHVDTDSLFKEISNKLARPGNNIKLTIDRDLQISGYNALKENVGGAVAIEVESGEVLAMVSRPSFRPSEFSRGLTSKYWSSLVNDDRNPLRDRVIQEHYPPGSTFKVVTAIAAMEEGVINKDTEVNCKGSFKLGRRVYNCWKKHGHGKVGFHKALRESCDVFFYKIATKLDIDILAKYARLFGLGSKTGITLPRETSGLVPTKDWKKTKLGEEWQTGETVSCVIGQSYVLVTPLQLAMLYATIANGGKLFKPFLVKEIFSNSGDIIQKNQKELISQIKIRPKTLKLVKEGLYQVVNRRTGTAWWHRGSGINMAGKTGTSQVVGLSPEEKAKPVRCEDGEYKFRDHALFVGYAPAENPKVVVAVIVEHGCHGSSAAAPVVKTMITTYMNKYYPDLVKKRTAIEKRHAIKMKRLMEAKKRAAEERARAKEEERKREEARRKEAELLDYE